MSSMKNHFNIKTQAIFRPYNNIILKKIIYILVINIKSIPLLYVIDLNVAIRKGEKKKVLHELVAFIRIPYKYNMHW